FSLPGNTLDACFSTDGKQLAVAREKQVLLLDAHSGAQRTIADLEDVQVVALRPNGKAVASIDRKGTLRAWELPEGKQSFTVPNCLSAGRLRFTDDGTALCFGVGLLRRLDAATGKPLLPPQQQQPAAWSADGNRVLLTGSQGAVVFDVATRKGVGISAGHLANGWSFSRDSRYVLWSSEAETVVHDAATGEEVTSWSAGRGGLVLSDRLTLGHRFEGSRRDPTLL